MRFFLTGPRESLPFQQAPGVTLLTTHGINSVTHFVTSLLLWCTSVACHKQLHAIVWGIAHTFMFMAICWPPAIPTGQYDEKVFRAFDYIFDVARRYNVRLNLAMTSNWQLNDGPSAVRVTTATTAAAHMPTAAR